MKKIILTLIMVIILAIAAGIYYVMTNLDSLVKAAIETHGSEATQTAVRVEKVSIKLTEGAGMLNGLTVANPNGFSAPYVFSLGEIGTRIDIQSLSEEPYIIEEITVRAPQVFVEMNQDKKTNLNELKKNLTASAPATSSKTDSPDKAGTAEPRLIIRRVVFTQGNLQARVVPINKEYQLKLPTLNMKNLGGKKGATPAQLTREIINRLIDQAREEVRKKGFDQELDKLKAKAKERVDQEKARVKEKTDVKVEDAKQKAMDKLKGLLGK